MKINKETAASPEAKSPRDEHMRARPGPQCLPFAWLRAIKVVVTHALNERRFIDDLPSISISRLRALGVVTAETTKFTVRLGDAEQVFGVTLRKFPACGGSWSFFTCGCGRRARVLRALNGKIMCRYCCIARGVRFRCEPTGSRQRAAMRVPKLLAMLDADKPLRLNRSTMTSTMERRTRHEAALQRCMLIVKRHELAALEKAIEKTKPKG
jgi:hypothetical protein